MIQKYEQRILKKKNKSTCNMFVQIVIVPKEFDTGYRGIRNSIRLIKKNPMNWRTEFQSSFRLAVIGFI